MFLDWSIVNLQCCVSFRSTAKWFSFTYIHSVQSLSRVQLFATPWTVARQASLSITNSWSLLKLMSSELVMPSNHLILCRPLLLLPSIFPSIRVFSRESAPCTQWPKTNSHIQLTALWSLTLQRTRLEHCFPSNNAVQTLKFRQSGLSGVEDSWSDSGAKLLEFGSLANS